MTVDGCFPFAVNTGERTAIQTTLSEKPLRVSIIQQKWDGWACRLTAAFLLQVSFLPVASAAPAGPDTRERIHLEIYNRDQALVREVRRVDLDKGSDTVDFHHIASGIYGHTTAIRPLDDDIRLTTAQLAYNYDLVSEDNLLQRYIGRWFAFATEDADYHGRLLHFDATHLFLQSDTTDPGVTVILRSKMTEMFYPSLPEMVYTRPTLRWMVEADKRYRDLPVEISYLTSDVTWMCDYRGELLSGDSLSLSGTFTISSSLPLDFPAAQVTLVAGWTNRSEDAGGGSAASATARDTPSGDRLFEYHRYPVAQPVDLFGGQTIQVPFFTERRVKAERRFVLPHLLDEDRVMVEMKFVNGAAAAGIPLPEGDVGLYQRTGDGDLSFIGEDFIDATPAGGEVKLQAGVAFDITARRLRTAQARPERDRHQESWEVELTSGREQPALVNVEQRVYGYYTVTEASVGDKPVEFKAEEAGKISFPVELPARSKAVLKFTITYGY